MSVHILDAMVSDGFEEVTALHDRVSGLRGFLILHDSSRGPAFGGIRRFDYANEDEMLSDGLRLAKAMTRKCALAELPAGGGKIVIQDDPELDLEQAYRYIGKMVERMGGRFYTGPDVGTDDEEMGWVAAETTYATKPEDHANGRLVEATGQGVRHGMEAALRHLDGEVEWPKRKVVIQGLGKVGAWLAESLSVSGARVAACDVDAERAAAVTQRLGVELIEPDQVLEHECDVFSPNAMGGILHDVSLARSRCRIVCGAANNVLAHEDHGLRIDSLGILFVPDFVVSCGALIRGAFFHLDERTLDNVEIGRRVGSIVERVLDLAKERSIPPAKVAVGLADGMIRAARGGEPVSGS